MVEYLTMTQSRSPAGPGYLAMELKYHILGWNDLYDPESARKLARYIEGIGDRGESERACVCAH